MRLCRGLASAAVAVACVTALPYVSHAGVPAGEDTEPPLFGATCRIDVTGSRVTAHCHNPYPDPDRVSLHVECVHWWDLDSDGAAVEAGPAQTVRLTGRCWDEVRSAWVSHLRGS
ncbi:hypothetical protein [Streptomyces leeuwenhoekii]|uniref:Secreted Protein n=1 Tax=Streptomyces leeuwenhoekii TaxID=1437453 RepID=A0A0F7W1Q2_STRLW|nr:hypothetical protein [Streptomyces leeuwenhoekii]KMS73858.1 hypothetical protein ACH49_22895 [Streptomyces leeuwenhoekii]CQR64778.1 Conserved Hypothetical Protein [Streptomyces leeuwenhoekii]